MPQVTVSMPAELYVRLISDIPEGVNKAAHARALIERGLDQGAPAPPPEPEIVYVEVEKESRLLIDVDASMSSTTNVGMFNMERLREATLSGARQGWERHGTETWSEFYSTALAETTVGDYGCWNGRKDLRQFFGYPHYRRGGFSWSLPQLAYAAAENICEERAIEMFHGFISEGPLSQGRRPWTLHQCPGGENRLCGNPWHIKVSKNKFENIWNRTRGGRHQPRKLSDIEQYQLALLQGYGFTDYDCAEEFGICPGTSNRYRRNRYGDRNIIKRYLAQLSFFD